MNILLSPKEFFHSIVEEAASLRSIQTSPMSRSYISELMYQYVWTSNLFELKEDGRWQQSTLAEQYLKANQAPSPHKEKMLKKLADSSLYISGFFGDSLKRKVVDVDYYIDMGCSAYGSLSRRIEEEAVALVYREISDRFLEFVDLLTINSQKVMTQSDKDLLRLYERYVLTGSELAKEQLAKEGLLNSQTIKVSGGN